MAQLLILTSQREWLPVEFHFITSTTKGPFPLNSWIVTASAGTSLGSVWWWTSYPGIRGSQLSATKSPPTLCHSWYCFGQNRSPARVDFPFIWKGRSGHVVGADPCAFGQTFRIQGVPSVLLNVEGNLRQKQPILCSFPWAVMDHLKWDPC